MFCGAVEPDQPFVLNLEPSGRLGLLLADIAASFGERVIVIVRFHRTPLFLSSLEQAGTIAGFLGEPSGAGLVQVISAFPTIAPVYLRK